MPIPFILAGISIAASAAGVKKGYDAITDNKKAKELIESAQYKYEKQKKEMENKKAVTVTDLENYAKLKLEIWEKQFGRFVSSVSKIKNIELSDKLALDTDLSKTVKEVNLNEMKNISIKAGELVTGGIMALGSGALAGLATTGGVTLLASASTGTAIASLSGVAATNATLAWFGGGSLAAGGFGMAGGAAVLGGIVAGPVIAVSGFLLAAKASENLEKARAAYAEAQTAVEQMKNMCSVLDYIDKLALQFNDMTTKLNKKFDGILNYIEMVVFANKDKDGFVDYKSLMESEKKMIHLSYMIAQTIKTILDTPIMLDDGSPNKASTDVLPPAEKLLAYIG